MPSFYELLKYAKTGISAPDMTAYDKIRAIAMAGGAKYPVQTITGVPPIRFRSDGSPLDNVTIIGNGQQTGTPSPDNIIMPDFCGKLVGTDWTIPITCAGQTVPVYLGQVSAVRQIKKKIFTGDPAEDWHLYNGVLYSADISDYLRIKAITTICSHYPSAENASGVAYVPEKTICMGTGSNDRTFIRDSDFPSASDFRAFLAEQYQNGSPLTVCYVLANEETGIVNEPLAKIGDYADELHSADAGVTIPTVRGINTLTVGTDLQPSEMSITGHIKPV